MSRLLTLSLLLLCTSGVSHAGAPASLGSSSRYFDYGSSSFYREQMQADLVARPDTLSFAFTLRKTAPDSNAALDALHALVNDLDKREKDVTGGAAAVHMHAMRIEQARDKQGNLLANQLMVVIDGVVDAPLAPELDYWARAKLLGAVSAATRPLVDAGREQKQQLMVNVELPRAVLKDPESFRADLIKLWVERARSFATQASSAGEPLAVESCDPPGAVSQRTLGLEEVALTLRQSCKLDVVKK